MTPFDGCPNRSFLRSRFLFSAPFWHLPRPRASMTFRSRKGKDACDKKTVHCPSAQEQSRTSTRWGLICIAPVLLLVAVFLIIRGGDPVGVRPDS